MNIEEALEKILNEEPIIVAGTTFETRQIDEVNLETGEKVFWIKDGGDMWLSLDQDAEEIILFTDIEEEIDGESDVAVYGGDDYEFSYETAGKIKDDGEELDKISYREFENNEGTVLRVTEYIVGGEVVASVGHKISEDELQEA